MNAPRRHLGAGAALSVVVQGGPLVAAATLSIVLARTIGPSGNGRFALLITLAGMTAMVVSLGLTAGFAYEVSRRRWTVREVGRTAYGCALGLGVVGFGAGLAIFAATRGSVFHDLRTELGVLALASVPPVIAYEYADAILLARERYEDYAALELTHSATLLVIGAGLAIPFGLTGAVVGLPAAAVAGCILGAVLLAREARRDDVDASGSLQRALGFGVPSWGANLLTQINYRFDVLLLAGFASARDVGVYSVALTLTSIAWVLPQALQTVLFPRVAALTESTVRGELSGEESDAALSKAVRHGVLLTLPAALLISALLLVAIPLIYGPKFHQTIWLGFVLLPGTLMLGIGKILQAATTGRGYPRYALYASAVTVVVTLALYLGLIPPFHAWGAAAGSSLSYAFGAVVALYFFRRVTNLSLRDAFLPRREDVSDYRGLVRLARAWRTGR